MRYIKGIIGAVIGDIIGSAHEFKPIRKHDFKLFQSACRFTDDTVLTMATASWMLDRKGTSMEEQLLRWGRKYPDARYGRGFRAFLKAGGALKQGSTHNGSAMRVSPVGFLSKTISETMVHADLSAKPSHNSIHGRQGASAIAAAIFLARTGHSKEEIIAFLEEELGFDRSENYAQRCDEIRRAMAVRKEGAPEERAQAHERLLSAYESAKDAVSAFMEASSYEETVRLAVLMGGDSDTLACMAGGIAAAFWGVPEDLVRQALDRIPPEMLELINRVDGTSWESPGYNPPPPRWVFRRRGPR